jgi:hypothetical protein
MKIVKCVVVVASNMRGGWWRHPVRSWHRWRHTRAYPRVDQVIRYHGDLVRVKDILWEAVPDAGRDELCVVWFDDAGRHEEWVSWMHCCELP